MIAAAQILADLAGQAALFDLSGDVGGKAIDSAEADQLASFDGERAPSGEPWAPLGQKYREWKEYAHPGAPIGVLHGNLRRELIGEKQRDRDSATLNIGATEDAASKVRWFEDGGENRPSRPIVGLSEDGVKASGDVFDEHFNGG